MIEHSYPTRLAWHGTTADGYRAYSRDHSAIAPPADAELALSADAGFRGAPERLNPEQLLAVAVGSCQLLTFLALAARAGIDVRDYEDGATAVLDTGVAPARITRVALTPVIRVAPGTNTAEVRRLAEAAHGGCFLANSLTAEVVLDVTVVDE